MKVSTDLFLMGVTLAWGPCFYSCTPIVLSYLAGTKQNWWKGLINVVVFSFARVFAYLIVIMFAFTIGNMVIRDWYESGYGRALYYIAGGVSMFLGYLMLFNKNVLHFEFCPGLIRAPSRGTLSGIVLLGLAIGASPCIPLFGVINYVVFEARSLSQAMGYALCFGAGTILSPLIPLGMLAGGVVKVIEKAGSALKMKLKVDVGRLNLFTRLCGVLLIYFGMKLILKQL